MNSDEGQMEEEFVGGEPKHKITKLPLILIIAILGLLAYSAYGAVQPPRIVKTTFTETSIITQPVTITQTQIQTQTTTIVSRIETTTTITATVTQATTTTTTTPQQSSTYPIKKCENQPFDLTAGMRNRGNKTQTFYLIAYLMGQDFGWREVGTFTSRIDAGQEVGPNIVVNTSLRKAGTYDLKFEMRESSITGILHDEKTIVGAIQISVCAPLGEIKT